MTRAANLLIIALYAAAIPLLAGLSDTTVDRLAGLIGLGNGPAIATEISDDDAIALALAATIANHRPPVLENFGEHSDADVADIVEILASLN